MPDFMLTNINRPFLTPLRASACLSAMCHLIGLSFKKTIPADWGLLFDHQHDTRFDTTMHTMWMRFTLGMVWIDEGGRVVDIKRVKPWKIMVRPQKAARYVLELLPGRLNEFQVGDRIEFEEIDQPGAHSR